VPNLNENPIFNVTELESLITDRTLILVGDGDPIESGDSTIHALGSAVRIAPSVALTAKHVVWGFWQKFQSTVLPSGSERIKTGFGVYGINFTAESETPSLWLVENVWCSGFSDLAILQIRNTDKQPYGNVGLKINALPPSPGEIVSAFGYPNSKIEGLARTSIGLASITFRVHALTTSGPVLQVFDNRRDRSLLNFPSFEINARFEGGMSGGPVFNQVGELCGIICSALMPATGVTHIAYAASLWPILGTTIDIAVPGCVVKGPHPLFELGNTGLMEVRNWDAIRQRGTTIQEDGSDRPWLN
jgi:hypothetical protein